MARRDILEYPDSRLRLTTTPVTNFDGSLNRFIDEMFETLYATTAIGLSATQVDDRRNVLVMDLSATKSAPEVYINAQIHAKAAWGLVEERCLSVPGVVANVFRATRVSMSAQDRSGDTFERELSGMHAVCLQHEMDHLEGKLFIDKLPIFEKLRLRFFSRSPTAKHVFATTK